MQKITPFLWFDSQAEEAMNFYLSVFKDSKAGEVRRYKDAGPGPAGSVMTASFDYWARNLSHSTADRYLSFRLPLPFL